MPLRNLSLIAIFLIVTAVLTGCPSVPSTRYDGWLYDVYSSNNGDIISQRPDGGYFVAGTAFINGDYRQYVSYSIDPSGGIESSFSLPGVFSQASTGPSATAILASDGHVYTAGLTVRAGGFGSENGRLRVLKTDILGNILWDNVYGEDEHRVPNSVTETSDGGIVVGAREIATDMSQTVFMKLNAQGNTVWTSRLGSSGISMVVRDAMETANGEIVSVGTRSSPEPTGSDFALLCLGGEGSTVWFNYYVRGQTQEARTFAPSPDGGFYLGGTQMLPSAKRRPYLLKTGADGEFEWDRDDIYEPERGVADVHIWDMVVDDEGYIAMVGDEIIVDYIGTIPVIRGNSFLMRLDPMGNLVKKTDISGLTYGIDFTQQGTYITTGVVEQYIRVLELDKAGRVLN